MRSLYEAMSTSSLVPRDAHIAKFYQLQRTADKITHLKLGEIRRPVA